MTPSGRAPLFLGLLVLQAAPAPAQERPAPQIIRRITILGLERLSEPAVTAKMRIRIGQVYDPQAVKEEAGYLFRLGEFSEVRDPVVRDFEDGVEVIYTVRERPRVATVRFEVLDSPSGKPSLSISDLREVVSTRTDGRLSDYSLKVDAEKLRQKYQEKGYSFSEVSFRTRSVPGGMEVTFQIHEGPRLHIEDIQFMGNRSLDSRTLRAVMDTTSQGLLWGLFHPGYYDQATLSRDIDKLTTLYQSKGFFEARLAVDSLEFNPSLSHMRISIRVEEGPRYLFRGYTFTGNRVFPTALLEGLTRAPVDQPYDEERMQEDRREIVKYYRDRAYIYALVRWQYVYGETGTDVQVRFEIEEGNEIYIEHVHIRKVVRRDQELAVVPGLRTQDRVVRRELEFYPGEKVNFSKLEKSQSNLARLQFFRDVQFRFEPGTSPERRDLMVDVEEEENTGQLILGFGVTSGFGVIGNFSILKRNFDITDLPRTLYELPDSFTGAGQTMNLVVQPGTQRSLYRATFVEPYLFESRNALSLSGSMIKIIRSDYDEDRDSFIPRIGHAFDFDRDLVFSLHGRIEQVEISNIDLDAAPDVFEAHGHTTIVAAGAGLSYDKVLHDRWEGPYQGHRETLQYEYGGDPLGGHIDFQRVEASLDLYFPLYVHPENQLHHVIGFFSKAGVIEARHSTEEIPIFERFFLGGPNTVRGFRFRGLGPHFGNDALGGAAAWYGNVEYVFPIFQKLLRGVVFLDYGNLASDFDSFEVFDEMRVAAGVGLRVNFPFLGGMPLPVGLYLGQAFKKEDDDRTRLFLFTIGVPF